MSRRRSHLTLCAALGTALALPHGAASQDQATLNMYGMPGLIDMPTANMLPDAELPFTISNFGDITRGTVAFQITPRLTGAFRYSQVRNFTSPGVGELFDRSFDLHWLAIEEAGWWPAVAVGIRDLAGTGVFSGEYVVATRHFGAQDQFEVTAGLGWGRLGTRNGFSNPLGFIDDRFDVRPPLVVGVGGTVSANQFFRGDAALFGGIEWQVNDRLRVQLEYSSDDYRREVARGSVRDNSPVNLGFTYNLRDNLRLGGQFLYGDTFGLSLTYFANPYRPTVYGTLDGAPEPVSIRASDAPRGDTSWLAQANGPTILRDNLVRLFTEDGGLVLENLRLDGQRATVRVRNTRYGAEAMALGRVLRAMSVTMPASVETFEVIFVVNDIDTSRIRVARSDVETFHDAPTGAEMILALAEVEGAGEVEDPQAINVSTELPRLTWGIGPYIEGQAFDPANPLLLDLGIEAHARYDFGGGWIASGALRARVVGNLDQSRSVKGPVAGPGLVPPPVVRSDAWLYNQQSDARIDHLTLSHFGQIGDDIYTRMTFGYLEQMYAGISGELLWQPARSEIGIGLELNHVWARDYDGGPGLRDYDVTTGHASLYFPVGGQFEGQIDVGRYLAGDWGATFRLDRTFANGWRLGAFATFTDVSFEEFGEGSFDKGFELEIPLGWSTGTSSRNSQTTTIRPVLRDGGARVMVNDRLHDLVTDYHRPSLQETEGMVWR